MAVIMETETFQELLPGHVVEVREYRTPPVPEPSLHRRHELLIPGVIPSTIPADIQSSHRVHFNCFVVINAAKQKAWVESH